MNFWHTNELLKSKFLIEKKKKKILELFPLDIYWDRNQNIYDKQLLEKNWDTNIINTTSFQSNLSVHFILTQMYNLKMLCQKLFLYFYKFI